MEPTELPSAAENQPGATAASKGGIGDWLTPIGAIITTTGAIFVACIANPHYAWAGGVPLVIAGCTIFAWAYLNDRRSSASRALRSVSLAPAILGLVAIVLWIVNRTPLSVQAIEPAQSPPPAQIADGLSNASFTGLSTNDVNPELAQRLGLPDGAGAYVAAVADKSPAQAARLQVGDVIRGCSGRPVLNPGDVIRCIHGSNAVPALKLIVWHEGQSAERELVLSRQP